MPTDVQSPFTPGVPVPVEFFSGRQVEIDRLRRKIRRSATGRLEVCFLAGERGIGKSSLATFVKHLAEREVRALGLHVFLGGARSLEEAIRLVFDRLVKETEQTSWFSKIKDLFGNHVRQVGLFGVSVEFDAASRDLRWLANNFSQSLSSIIDRLRGERDCIFLILDDINGLADSSEFAEWLKSLVDGIAVSQARLPLSILLVGLTERREELISHQPSLMRVFDPIEINPWSHAETIEFFKKAFAKTHIYVTDEAMSLLAFYAGGLPVLAHEIGDAAFHLDTDGKIDQGEAIQAVLQAAEIVGRKHLRPQVFRAIHSRRYRSILKKIADTEGLSLTFTRAGIQRKLDRAEQGVFDNFLRRMESLGVVTRSTERGRCHYQFVNQLHAIYFWMVFAELPTPARGPRPRRPRSP